MSTFETSLRKYIQIFIDQEMYFINDIRTLELFGKNPLNTKAEDIKTKISAMSDNAEIRQLKEVDDMVKHIRDLKIDDRLKKGDIAVVDEIANLTSGGKSFHLLNFASVYCNFHRPDVFPIYIEDYFDFYKGYIKENKLPIDPQKLTQYGVFAQALNDLVTRYGLKGKMNYLQFRKFAWLYADHVFKESGAVVDN